MRICPLWPQTAQVLKEFVSERMLDLRSNAPVFCNQRGERLSRFGIEICAINTELLRRREELD
jgi:hypothetical protein